MIPHNNDQANDPLVFHQNSRSVFWAVNVPDNHEMNQMIANFCILCFAEKNTYAKFLQKFRYQQ